MEKKDVIRILKQFKKLKGRNYDILRIGLFGSVARGMIDDRSDIDVVVVLGKPDMFNLIGIKQDLEEEFECGVDLVRHRKKMNPFLKKRIEKEAIYV
jgi:predicted nucleotidyltransferase